MEAVEYIKEGKTGLGIELGSTRIKAVLIDENGLVLATGIYDWENSFINGIWTYDIEEVKIGLKACYKSLKDNILKKYDVSLKKFSSLGISAMMHGYLVLDKEGRILAPFQTWRNTNTEIAADKLCDLFNFNIPLRWSIAHLYQRILDKEKHVEKISYITTLAGYVHFLLSGQKVLGIGDASGMFPIDSSIKNYNEEHIEKFNEILKLHEYNFSLKDILPKVLLAGDFAGNLTESGASLLDDSGELESGIPLCPPEGDAATGMVATGAISPKTGNFSAGTSMFAMLVLEKDLKKYYKEIDIVTTPEGYPVAMSHANNGTSDLNAWVDLFEEFYNLMGYKVEKSNLYEKLYKKSLEGDFDCGDLMAYGYYSGEGIFGINEGRPLFMRSPNSRFNLANFMRVHLYSSLVAVKVGLDILKSQENVDINLIYAHGGLFKTKEVGQRYLAAAMACPVEVFDNATEGGAFGMAVLARYSILKEKSGLDIFLKNIIFKDVITSEIIPSQEEIDSFEKFTSRYMETLRIEEEAIRTW